MLYIACCDARLCERKDYWLSLMHRRLVGSIVLQVNLDAAPNTTRVYAHCTRYLVSHMQSQQISVLCVEFHNELLNGPDS